MSVRKVIFNSPDGAVQEAITGLLLTRGDIKLAPGTDNVIVRSDIETYRNDYVTVICGGGSGHEPAHAGYIGDGMLSCAVLGNVFASPSVNSVFRAIQACSSPHGVLVIVKNYTGDRLNFGMAIEKAKSEGIDARMVIVGDDCTVVGNDSIAGRRGVAGTLFVQKIAGAKAFHHKGSIDDVCAAAKMACRCVRTMGIALTSCSLPTSEKSERLTGPQMEVGIGIHGEPGRGIEETPRKGLATAMTKRIVQALADDYQQASGNVVLGKIAVLVNNLGTTTDLELNAFVAALFPELTTHGALVQRLFCGSFMTALDMNGVSVTIYNLDMHEASLDLLDASVSAPAWKQSLYVPERNISSSYETSIIETPTILLSQTIFPKNAYFTGMILAVCSALVNAEPLLTQLDSICGDGDCGQTVQAAAKAVFNKLLEVTPAEAPLDYSNEVYASTCSYLAENASATMGGTLGAIFELLLRAMANCYHTTLEPVSFPLALEKGIEAITFYGGARVGMRTMLDALIPAVDVLKLGGDLSSAAEAAKRGADDTGLLAGLAGRSSYVNPDAIQGVEDPGATAVAIAFRAAAKFSSLH